MSLWTDMIDWLGGYPFEVAKLEEVIAFFTKYGLCSNVLRRVVEEWAATNLFFVATTRDAVCPPYGLSRGESIPRCSAVPDPPLCSTTSFRRDPTPMRVTFVISSLGLGGAERTMSIMANYWAAKGWDITLICLDGSATPFYELHPNVHHVPLGVSGASSNAFVGVTNNWVRIRAVRRTIISNRPDVVISFMETLNVLTIIATRFLRIPVVVSEHMLPWIPLYEYGSTRTPLSHLIWKMLRARTYPFCSLLVVLSAEYGRYYAPSIQARTKVIPNCVKYVAEDAVSLPNGASRPLIIAMGRLAAEKGFDHLLTAFSRLGDKFPQWFLVILGEGPMRTELESMIAQLGLSRRAHLAGAVAKPYAYLQQADLFVLSSRFEAFPNALLESMAAGVPVVSYDCCEGVRDIVRDGVDGVLVPPGNLEALVSAMENVMNDQAKRSRMADRAMEVRERFSVEKIMQMWEDAIQGVCRDQH